MKGQVNIANEAKFHSPTHSTFEAPAVQRAVGVVTENWAFSVDQCWLQTLEFSVHLMDFFQSALKAPTH